MKLIYRFINLKPLWKAIISPIRGYLQQMKEFDKALSNQALNSFELAQLDPESQENVQNLFTSALSSVNQLVNLETNLPKIAEISRSQVIEDFRINNAPYYAVIDQMIGATSHTASDLPSFIVEKVKEFPLNTEGLAATLRPYQEFGVKYALTFKKTLLGDEMGLGKTIQAIAVANHLNNQGVHHHIVIGPLSILSNWDREIKKFSYFKTFIFRNADRQKAFTEWQEKGGFLLLNYEQAKHLVNLEMSNSPGLLVVDEAHLIKNPQTQRAQSTNKLANRSAYNLFLSGTPLENRVSEMKQLITVLNPDLGRAIDVGEWTDNPEQFKQEIASVYLRRKRDEVLRELPEIETIEMWSRFSEIEQEFYNEAVMMGISGLMKMRRAGFYGKSLKDSEKIANTVGICEEALENGDKIIIFSFFKKVLNELKFHLGDNVVGMISGDVSNEMRQQYIDDLEQAGEGAILLSQIDAGGVGLNIQAANVVVLCEPQWKPSTEQQAIGRVYRMGQNKNVIVYRLLTEESIDETMLEILGEKTDIFNQYAHDSVAADAFDRAKVQDSPENQEQLKAKVIEIEQARLKQAK
ncbi:DEAD/DEAH box helicase [Hutsoniella sourekii]